jgi:serine/threonine protein kinase
MLPGVPYSALFPGQVCPPVSDGDYEDPWGQLQCILRVLGRPSDLSWIPYDEIKRYVRDIPFHRGRTLEQRFPGAAPEAIGLLAGLLRWDPRERLSAAQALEHPFFKDYEFAVTPNPPPPDLEALRAVEERWERSLEVTADEVATSFLDLQRRKRAKRELRSQATTVVPWHYRLEGAAPTLFEEHEIAEKLRDDKVERLKGLRDLLWEEVENKEVAGSSPVDYRCKRKAPPV